MEDMQYNYMGKTWRPCPTAAEGNCFFNAVFGTRNTNDQPYQDKHAQFRRKHWSSFLEYYSAENLPDALVELLKKCFMANDRYQQKSIQNSDNYAEYMQDITISEYRVLVDEIPLLATLANIRVVLFISDPDEPQVFDPNPELLGKFPWQSINAIREVVICLVDNHFSRLQPYDRSEEIKSTTNEENFAQNQDSNREFKEIVSLARKKSYKKRGSAGTEGILYQIDVLTMVLLNAMTKVEKWHLATEDEDADKFDDLIFELPSGSTILLQAKHKKNETKKVTYEDLVSENFKNEFSLPKYFFSYQEILIRNKFKVQNVVISTNLNLDESVKKYLKQASPTAESVLHFQGTENICYSFKGCCLPRLKQNIKTYYSKYVQNKKVVISDEAIEDFLAHLLFFPNYLAEKNLDNIIEDTISRVGLSLNLDNKVIFKTIHKKMLDWFKEEKGTYLTEVEAKGFFCDIRSNKYCEDLKLYDISFEKDNLDYICQKIEGRSKDPKRILHIISDKEYILNVIKIYQALQQSRHETKALIVNPDETIDVQKQIIDAFKVQHYTILVVVCNKTIEEKAVTEMCDKVWEILNNYKYKYVILIAGEENNLAKQIKESNIDYYEAIADNITFSDLDGSTQENFKRKKSINFQGCNMSLGELFKPSMNDILNQNINSEMLVKLARGDEIEVGLTLQHLNKYYIHRIFKRNGHRIPEENMYRPEEISREKVVLISDSAGMGKSTVLTSLAIAIKKYNPQLWVVRVDLNNYTNVMRTSLNEGSKAISIREILESQEKFKLKNEFEEKLFMNPERVVLMLDGVDEVCPSYTDLVINLLTDLLIQPNLIKIFVTSRPHLCQKLEEVLKVQSFTLEPFSKGNQTDFLSNYWIGELHLQDEIKKRKCVLYAKTLIEEIHRWIGDNPENMFAGIPLQTRMLAEVFQEEHQVSGEEPKDWEGCKEFVSSDGEKPRLPRKIHLIQLYDMFIKKKLDIFLNDKSNPGGSVAAEAALNEKFEECHEYHRSLALEQIVGSRKQELFTCPKDLDCSSSFVDNYLLRAGIIQLQGEKLYFIHRTFAEYYVAECILIELKSEVINAQFYEFFICEILSYHDYKVVLAFLISFIKSEPLSVKNKIFDYFWSSNYTKCLLDIILDMTAVRGNVIFLRIFIEFVKATRVQGPFLYIPDFLQMHLSDIDILEDPGEWIMYAIEHGRFDILKFFIENDPDIDTKAAVYAKKGFIEAITLGHLGIIKLLVEEAGVDVNYTIYDYSLLEIASAKGHLSIVKYLVEQGATVNSKPLNVAAFWGHLSIVKLLVKSVNVEDSTVNAALRAAILGGNLEIVKFVVKEFNANIKDIPVTSEMILGEHARKATGMLNKRSAVITRAYLEVVEFMVEQNCQQLTEALEALRNKLGKRKRKPSKKETALLKNHLSSIE